LSVFQRAERPEGVEQKTAAEHEQESTQAYNKQPIRLSLEKGPGPIHTVSHKAIHVYIRKIVA
jgi:hypothetical protein